MSKSTYNARIASTMLGYEDHRIFTAMLYLEWPGAGIGFGGYALDQYDDKTQSRIDTCGLTHAYIEKVLDTVGVNTWEDLKGQYVRLETEGWGGKAIAIGHLMEDKWFFPKEWLEGKLAEILK